MKVGYMKQLVIAGLVSFVAGAAIGKYFWPNVKVRTEIQEKEVIRKDIRTVTRTIKRPDGTKETVRESVDNSVQNSSRTAVHTVAGKPNWNLGVSVAAKVTELQPIYGLQASRRIIGPFFVGATANTVGQFGLLLEIEL
jgi:hypothetical protein